MANNFRVYIAADNREEVMAEVMAKAGAAMEAVGQTAESMAAKVAPYKTGALKQSITHAVTSTDTTVSAHVGTNLKAPKTGAPYPLYQEVGTSRIAGKHYLEFGIKGYISEYMDTIRRYLQGHS